MRKPIWLILLFMTMSFQSHAQEIDILIKNGHVFDAKNKIDGIADVSIANGKIVQVASSLPDKQAKQVIDATGFYVVPGLIDPHTHVFVGSRPDRFANGFNSLSPDDFTFKSGVTTVVDAGTSGSENFAQFKSQVIDQSKTRVLAYLNIAAKGLDGTEIDLPKSEAEKQALDQMDVAKTAATILQYPEIIVGVKIGHFQGTSWAPFERAVAAAAKTGRPLFVECHLPEYSLEDQLKHMRPGDIITHSFENITERAPVVNAEGKVLPYVLAAKERGILFDVGHGGAGFWFDQAIPAFEQGLWPNSFGTDLHRFSMNAGMKDMLNVMSKYLSIGMPLNDVLVRGSWFPARALKREDLGNLSPGTVADVAILSIRKGNFGFIDAKNNGIKGDKKLEAEMTIRAGKVVWDLNGLAAKPFERK